MISTKPAGFSKPGWKPAICVGFIEIGTIFIETKWQHQIRLVFELPQELQEYKPGEPPMPKMLGHDYASVLHNRSHLKRDLISWMGEQFVLDNQAGIDPELLLGRYAMINLVHGQNYKTKQWYEDYVGIDKCDFMTGVSYYNMKIITFEQFDVDYFWTLPVWIANKIARSREFQALGIPYPKETPKTVEVQTLQI